MSNTLFIMACPLCGKQYKVTESQTLIVCECGNTLADERYFKLTKEGELVAR
jgi:ribosomal protein L37AE/L43A